ncbi:TRAP transporter substrate-binding protein [Alteromonas sp. 1_MG-2023]|uniref:TRAP transporter substrate-binding protein n=1 Tax=Alteromonas sp. 1_MG-2023 TaxID=3062669 RepID=UPI0026E4002E|nr:TRAP transporter substrate-binding protein [Alteromonas sp. 1_MG-2023]MDO6566660.1 TRAP transporter substrate-binding protein [Alteromonas sp. 1_MG-2023]
MGDQLDSDQGAFAERFEALVETYSEGKLNVRLYPGGILGAEPEMVQNTRLGAQSFALIGVTNLAPFSKEMGMLALPYLIADSEDAVKMTTGTLGEHWNNIAKKQIGVEILGWTYSNFRHLTNSKKPVASLEDLEGLKIRVPQNPIMLATYEAWGANAIAMSWTETFTALQQRVVDGQDNPYIVNDSMKFYEIQSYLTELHYMYSLQPLVVGVRAFNKMSDEDKRIIRRAGREASEFALAYQLQEASKAKKHMQSEGVEVYTLKDESRWESIAKNEVWPLFYESVGGKESVDWVMSQLNTNCMRKCEKREDDNER